MSGGSGIGGGTFSSAIASKPQPEVRKVRALYDFEAAEENELTFMTGEMIYVVDDSDPNWWKGYNNRGEGLFPSNFVTADLDAEPEASLYDEKTKLSEREEFKAETVEIDEGKIDRLLQLLHDANPEDPSQDTEEMFILEAQVNQMLPLIDSELERVDRNHAKLTHLSGNLVDAINMYHTLMRDAETAGAYGMMPHQMNRQPFAQPMPNGMYSAPNGMYAPAGYSSLPHQQLPPQQMVGNQFHSPNHVPQAYQPPSMGPHPQFVPGPNTSVAPQHLPGPPPQYQPYASPQPQSMIKNEAMHQMNNTHPPPHQMMQQPHSLPYVPVPHSAQSFHNNYPNTVQQPPAAGQPTMMPPSHQQNANPNMSMPQEMNGASYMPNTVMTAQIQPGQPPQAHLPSNHPNAQPAMHQPPIHHNPMLMQNNMAAINQPVTSTILPQSDQRTNIPVYQQQR